MYVGWGRGAESVYVGWEGEQGKKCMWGGG